MASTTYRFLTASQVKRLYVTYIKDAVPTQPSLLESAVNSPINIKHYEKQLDLFQLAASLSEKIVKNHAFQDGNKRAALVAAEMFLRINGWRLQDKILANDSKTSGLADALIKVAMNEMTATQLGDYYRGIAARVIVQSDTLVQQYRKDATAY